ncbi:pseudo histidine-containing phosphotransfer protein 6-like [Prosopis cineraria]|uniref:pseudo histidine-containing phosphotransfer protein 6-like n=1 Tax=Prosopis cineraria TaxID=364024 RepID=UPI0024101CDF|nr:pseudo histidine-containing phosphotransfer protein 6-like [Prosopis cineraria]
MPCWNQKLLMDNKSCFCGPDKTGVPVWELGLGGDRLWADMNRLVSFLLHHQVLDEQFLQLHQLQDLSSPFFVSQVFSIYFHESEKLLSTLRSLLMDKGLLDLKKMAIHLNQFMGSSSSIGAKRIRNACLAFRASILLNNRPGCLRALEMLEQEYCYLKNKLHELFQIEQQRVLAAGVRYPVGAELR